MTQHRHSTTDTDADKADEAQTADELQRTQIVQTTQAHKQQTSHKSCGQGIGTADVDTDRAANDPTQA